MSETERLKDVIQKNNSRIAELARSIEGVVNSFSEESNRILETTDQVEGQLKETDQRIATLEDNITKLEEKKQNLRSDINSAEQQVKDLERKITSLTSEINATSKELLRTEDTLKQYRAKIEAMRADDEKHEKTVDELQGNIEKTRSSNEREFQERRAGLEEAQSKIKELVEREPVADFLLTEASTEPPEIAIVAGLIKGGGTATVDELKKTTKVPPAIAMRTINALEQKGVVAREGSDRIRLEKTAV